MWVRFTAEYWHRVRHNVRIRYKEDMVISVPTAIANEAVAKGKAVKVARQSREPAQEPARYGETTERE